MDAVYSLLNLDSDVRLDILPVKAMTYRLIDAMDPEKGGHPAGHGGDQADLARRRESSARRSGSIAATPARPIRSGTCR
jgi:hypothetical protein